MGKFVRVVLSDVMIFLAVVLHLISVTALLFYFMNAWAGNDVPIIKVLMSLIVSAVTVPAVNYINTKAKHMKLKEENEKVTSLIK